MNNISAFTIGCILSLQTLCTCVISIIGQFIYAYYLDIYSNSSNKTSNFTITNTISTYNFLRKFTEDTKKCSDSDILADSDAQSWAQEKSADLYFWTNLYCSGPLIIMTYILGLYTPKLGRRLILTLPMVGILFQFIIWLTIIYFHLPDYWWYISSVIIGLSGSTGVLSMK